MSIAHRHWPVILLVVILFAGCDQASRPASSRPAPATSAAPPPPAPVTESAAGQPQPAPTTTTTPPGASTSAPQPTSVAPTTAQAAGTAIQLSAGVALPQTGPEGTFMSFSVDYQFTQGAPGPTDRYVWVIQPAQGNPLEFAAALQAQGTLQEFVPKLRPESGPFRAHIEQIGGQPPRRTVSNTVELQ